MELKKIKEMIALMNENDLQELEVEEEGIKIRLKKFSSDLDKKSFSEIHSKGELSLDESKIQIESPNKLIELKAPMVGTFYSAPSPDSPPFVQVEDEIDVGQVVCIIEAMKLMNEIKSEVRGKIVKVLIENAEPVEFGQPLFSIQPT